MTSTLDNDPEDNDNNSMAYLSYLEYREMDQENGDNRTILINGVPDWAIRLKPNRYYKQKAVENLVCGCCDRNNLDYGSLGTVTKCVEEIISKVNSHDDYVANTHETEIQKLPILSVSDVLRKHSGRHRTLAMIVGVSQPYKVITAVEWSCRECGFELPQKFDPPLSTIHLPKKKCPICRSSSSQDKEKQKQSDLIGLIDLPKYENAKNISVHDSQSSEDLEKLQVVLMGGDMTRNVRVGDTAIITGTMHVVTGGGNYGDNGKGANGKLPHSVLYAESIEYQTEIADSPITEQDIQEFKEFAARPTTTVTKDLVAKFAPNVIGHSDAKLGLLRSAVNSKSDADRRRRNRAATSMGDIRLRLHTLFGGDPGTAKTTLAEEAVKIVPNSRKVTAQHVSVKSVLGIIDKEQDNKMLMLGAVPQARNAICSINEVGTMDYEDQQHFADVLEEGHFTINKHGIYQDIDSPTTIVATTNPKSGYWDKAVSMPSLEQLPIKSNILDRFDQYYAFEDFQTDEERDEYAEEKMRPFEQEEDGGGEEDSNNNNDQENERIARDYEFLRKYLHYAATEVKNPILTPEANLMLRTYWKRLCATGRARNRTLDSLIRISKAQARLHLKNKVDAQIAEEVIQDVDLMYAKVGMKVNTTNIIDPRDLAYNEIIEYINTLNWPVTFEEAARHVCENNEVVKHYLGGWDWSIRGNKKLRAVHDRFTDNSGIGSIKTAKGGIGATIIKVSPLTLTKVVVKQGAKQQQQQTREEEKKKSITVEESGRSLRSLRSLTSDILAHNNGKGSLEDRQSDQSDSSDLLKKLVEKVIPNAMRDKQGHSKDYFTKEDFIYSTQMLPNERWTENEAEQTLYALLEEGKIQETEEGSGKFKPTTTEKREFMAL